jgi:hypothetical protein
MHRMTTEPSPGARDMRSARKFRIGQTVYYRSLGQRRLHAPSGLCQITRFLPPHENGEFEYQIRDLEAGDEWAASEKELRSA